MTTYYLIENLGTKNLPIFGNTIFEGSETECNLMLLEIMSTNSELASLGHNVKNNPILIKKQDFDEYYNEEQDLYDKYYKTEDYD